MSEIFYFETAVYVYDVTKYTRFQNISSNCLSEADFSTHEVNFGEFRPHLVISSVTRFLFFTSTRNVSMSEIFYFETAVYVYDVTKYIRFQNIVSSCLSEANFSVHKVRFGGFRLVLQDFRFFADFRSPDPDQIENFSNFRQLWDDLSPSSRGVRRSD